MRTVSTTIDIDAPAERVWRILAETAAYPEWNPFIVSLDGALDVGSRIAVTIAPPGGKKQNFKPTVTVVDPGRRVVWLGTLGLRGLFDGEHSFEVAALGATSSRFTQSERFSGILVPAFRGLLSSTEAGFAAMNSALATRATA